MSSGRAATSAAVRTGLSSTGPTPGTMSTPTPASLSGMTMSEKKMAASTSWRRTGWRVISEASSGRRQESSIAMPSRTLRYSGSERPAWRMNQTGRRDGLAAAVGGDQRGIRGAAVHQRVPGVEAGDFGGCRSARSHAFDCAENRPQKITTACHRPGHAGPGRGGARWSGGGNHTPACAVTRRAVVLRGYEKAMIVLLWFFFLWWRPTPTSTSRPLLN